MRSFNVVSFPQKRESTAPARAAKSDRGRKGFRLPSLRTVRAVLPHTALQSLVSSSGVSRVFIGRKKGEQPLIREEGVGPSHVVRFATPHRRPPILLAQNRSQPSPDEAVKDLEHIRFG